MKMLWFLMAFNGFLIDGIMQARREVVRILCSYGFMFLTLHRISFHQARNVSITQGMHTHTHTHMTINPFQLGIFYVLFMITNRYEH